MHTTSRRAFKHKDIALPALATVRLVNSLYMQSATYLMLKFKFEWTSLNVSSKKDLAITLHVYSKVAE